jgi:hypothetical protein
VGYIDYFRVGNQVITACTYPSKDQKLSGFAVAVLFKDRYESVKSTNQSATPKNF